jgi:hypothetical protein
MPAHNFQIWRLGKANEDALALSCELNGLFLGRTPLIEKHGDCYELRDRSALERLFAAAYGDGIAVGDRIHRLHAIAKALNDNNLPLATISAVLLRLPDLESYSARNVLENEDYLLKVQQHLPGETDTASTAKVVSLFNPDKHPRWPAGQPDGGEFRPGDGTFTNDNSPILPVSDESDRHTIGGNKGPPLDEPPEVPPEPPPSNKVRNQWIRTVAQWLARASGIAAGKAGDWRAKALAVALQGASWLVDALPSIISYFDKPKDLRDLQDAANQPSEEGYQDHHIVEEQADSKHELSNTRLFGKDQLQGSENVVRIPYWKHWEISAWYSKPNEDFGWQTPRDYMRGKSWEEQYNFGLEQLRKRQVLK